ncbi:MAG TPA: hypothetical protein VFX28_17370 [Methylomirabilota bacterium]|nr:hypothetical protein [Methylomirabilota bacterium]
MRGQCRANGLMLAGVIVALIGLAVVVAQALDVPRAWVPVGAGAALFAAGAVYRASARGGDSR